MKNLLLCLVLSAFVFSCDKGGDNDDKGKLDPNAMVSLRPAQNTKTESTNPEHLTALEIVEQADNIEFWNLDITTSNSIGRSFHEGQRDIANVRLLMFGTDIIGQDGEYVSEFIESEDIILVRVRRPLPKDTVGYIKNATLRDAEARIKVAYANKDYTACYAIFDEAFTFIPITGAEWNVLKEQGIN